MGNLESTDTYYHYTDEQGVEGIAKENKIRPSTDHLTDTMMGKGVYLTTKDPEEHTKEEILQNNYDSALPSRNPERESTGTYYHYTDDKGVKGIEKEKKIRPSTDPRAMMMGKGVYMTTKDPEEHTKEEILRNNYGSALPSRNPERVKHAVKMTMPTSHVEKAENSPRDVYKNKGEDELDLNNYPHEIIEVDKPRRSQKKWPVVLGSHQLVEDGARTKQNAHVPSYGMEEFLDHESAGLFTKQNAHVPSYRMEEFLDHESAGLFTKQNAHVPSYRMEEFLDHESAGLCT